ncbi:hypothetical protein [Chlorobium sp. N1]|uniref:hypothetical protein n=1 Tax=Chlorobium sp. N1 TaxID=2491138 RepID=UPI0013F15823|nr:hypothetical protein [Chlorobium sp. N1]
MTPGHRTTGARAAITLWSLWQARDLLGAWQHSGYDRYGWLVLLVWCAPLFIFRLSGKPQNIAESQDMRMLPIALLLTLAGQIGSLHILQHAGLAVALASWLPFSPLQLLWTLSALTWMPAYGWIGSRLFYEHILTARMLPAVMISGAFALMLANRKTKTT